MKILFFVSFTFTTGGIEYKEYRNLLAKNNESAYDVSKKWFSLNFPESELLSVIVHATIV